MKAIFIKFICKIFHWKYITNETVNALDICDGVFTECIELEI